MASLLAPRSVHLSTGRRSVARATPVTWLPTVSHSIVARPFSIGLPAQHVSLRSRPVICKGLFGLGLPELAVIAGVAALVFGPSKLPEIGKGLGKTVKSFQTAAKEFETELKSSAAVEETKVEAKETKVEDKDFPASPKVQEVPASPKVEEEQVKK